MMKLLAMLMVCLLGTPIALANEYAAIRLEATLSYTPMRVSVQDTVHLVTRNDARNSWDDEHVDSVFLLGLPEDWTACETRTGRAFAAWQNADGGIHAEFFHTPVPYDHIAAHDMMMAGDTFLDWQQYNYAWCEVDLFPRLTAIGMEDGHAYAYEYNLNGKPNFMYLRRDQRVLVLWEPSFEFGLILWADDGAVLPCETLLTEIASTLWYGMPEYLDVAE